MNINKPIYTIEEVAEMAGMPACSLKTLMSEKPAQRRRYRFEPAYRGKRGNGGNDITMLSQSDANKVIEYRKTWVAHQAARKSLYNLK